MRCTAPTAATRSAPSPRASPSAARPTARHSRRASAGCAIPTCAPTPRDSRSPRSWCMALATCWHPWPPAAGSPCTSAAPACTSSPMPRTCPSSPTATPSSPRWSPSLAEPRFPDPRSVRRSFDRPAPASGRPALLQREGGERLALHLDPTRIAPSTVLDIGRGTGEALAALARRFPAARVIGVDTALGMLDRARARTPAWKRLIGARPAALVGADAERLPLAPACAQLAHSNLTLQWCRPEAVFAEVARVLEPNGLFLFSTFGPDTLKELREAFAAVDGHDHVNTFVDMHDLGDALVHAGFADPVMEMEVLTLEYADVAGVARDLKAIGAGNALPGRPRGLSGRGRWQRMEQAYERHRRGEVLPATYEVIYGHAWKVAPRHLADGRQVIDFKPRPGP